MQKKKEIEVDIKKVETPLYIPQKSVKNGCLQSLEVYFIKRSGEVDTYWLKPNETINIPVGGVTSQLKLLQERRMVRIGNV